MLFNDISSNLDLISSGVSQVKEVNFYLVELRCKLDMIISYFLSMLINWLLVLINLWSSHECAIENEAVLF